MLNKENEILNEEKILKFQSITGSEFHNIIEKYLFDTANYIEELKLYIAKMNVERISALTHKMKSSSYQIGAQEFADIISRIESSSSYKNKIDYSAEFSLLEKCFIRLEKALLERTTQTID